MNKEIIKHLVCSIFLLGSWFSQAQEFTEEELESDFNTALKLEANKEYLSALSLFEKCLTFGYRTDESSIHDFMCSARINEELKMETPSIRLGLHFNENNQDLILTYLNYQILKKKNGVAIDSLEVYLVGFSDSYALRYGIAVMYDLGKEEDRAEQMFIEANEQRIKMEGEPYFEALYGLGAQYFNRGAQKHASYARTKDEALKEGFMNEANDFFNKGIAICLHIDSEIRPNDEGNLWLLQQLYVATNQKEKANEIKLRLKAE